MIAFFLTIAHWFDDGARPTSAGDIMQQFQIKKGALLIEGDVVQVIVHWTTIFGALAKDKSTIFWPVRHDAANIVAFKRLRQFIPSAKRPSFTLHLVGDVFHPDVT